MFSGMVGEVTIWVLVFCFDCFPILVNSQNLTCNSNDVRGLRGFMNGLESPIEGWFYLNSISSSFNCCNWVGINCNFNSGRIVRLELPNKRLTGCLSDLVSSIDHLRTLNLSHNFFNGPVPVSLFRLAHLEVVDLSSNDFNGVIPVSIHLPALQLLDVSDNGFHGSIPAGICANLNRVRILKFAVNSLTGSIPFEFQNCTFLEHICVASNFLSGVIPEFLFHLPRLMELDLQDNDFTSIARIGNSSSRITHLDVSSNELSGKVPDFFHKFPNLTHFSAQSNRFSGGIPSSLSNGFQSKYCMTNILTRYESFKKMEELPRIHVHEQLATEYRDVCASDELVEMIERHLEEKRIKLLDKIDLEQMEQHLGSFLQQVRIRKTHLKMGVVKALQDKETELKKEKQSLMDEIAAARMNGINNDSDDAEQRQLPTMDIHVTW